MWWSAFQSTVASQQGQDWRLVSTRSGSGVQPKTRKNRFTSHLRNSLGKFSELTIVMILRYCLSKFPNVTVSNAVLHNLAQKIFCRVHKVGIVCSLKKGIGFFLLVWREKFVYIRLIQKSSYTNYFPLYKICPSCFSWKFSWWSPHRVMCLTIPVKYIYSLIT